MTDGPKTQSEILHALACILLAQARGVVPLDTAVTIILHPYGDVDAFELVTSLLVDHDDGKVEIWKLIARVQSALLEKAAF